MVAAVAFQGLGSTLRTISGPPILFGDKGQNLCFGLPADVLQFTSDRSAHLNTHMSSKSGAPKLKRQRTEEAIPRQRQQTLKRSEYWFDDGNIILQVENTLFRVHRGMLAHHSEVLKDMFEIPQPENPNELQVEGCPVVPLYDSLEDVEIIISIFYGKFK